MDEKTFVFKCGSSKMYRIPMEKVELITFFQDILEIMRPIDSFEDFLYDQSFKKVRSRLDQILPRDVRDMLNQNILENILDKCKDILDEETSQDSITAPIWKNIVDNFEQASRPKIPCLTFLKQPYLDKILQFINTPSRKWGKKMFAHLPLIHEKYVKEQKKSHTRYDFKIRDYVTDEDLVPFIDWLESINTKEEREQIYINAAKLRFQPMIDLLSLPIAIDICKLSETDFREKHSIPDEYSDAVFKLFQASSESVERIIDNNI